MNKLPEKAVKKPNIEVLADADAVARRCLEIFIARCKALKSQNRFNLAIPGGRSPEKFFKLLAEDPAAIPILSGLPWNKIHIFWVDERYVPHDTPISNYKLAADTFLHKIPMPEQNIHPIPTPVRDAVHDFEDIREAARRYEKAIRSVFRLKAGQLPRFDLIILGLGVDGHVASLLPGSNALLNTADIACPVYIPGQPIKRITLTHPVLCAAEKLVILATGLEKSQILKNVLNSPPDKTRYPVHFLWPALDKILWLADSSAARLLIIDN